MNIEAIRTYCLGKKGTSESFPFDEDILVFKVLDKMFALISLKKWESGQAAINLKADPDYSERLRAQYSNIRPGYHMSKKHWNTLYLHEGQLALELITHLIDHSYDMVVKGMTKKMRDNLNNL
ncbi:MmcQ/YjbR family DNA-binding protein [Tamlana fucoidanivorans]|uniref:MmcQ/YjbR family DNA-binding protein n=1 Tax=Allotamlana fucoidanivorans TaxID=2583814 RepID=A0A5C4SPB8_9FLAO|nr:MmcQ/YjbR family DNA-binding protein [Tamlana fucoidanivorans]TNJ45244.1 MmcQ/YjbR family DNA-binding protein [Tamlana fucoidanivorans]